MAAVLREDIVSRALRLRWLSAPVPKAIKLIVGELRKLGVLATLGGTFAR
jgi:hypothetical protein